jgi:hypothetical protein
MDVAHRESEGAETGARRRDSWRSRLLWFLPLVLVYGLIVFPIVWTGRGGPSEEADQDRHHFVVVEKMYLEWPDVDIVDYPSATSPGYHLLLAGIGRAVGDFEAGKPLMRWVNAFVGLAAVGAAYWVCSVFTTSRRAMALTLPLCLSQYVLGAGAYISTDNAALAMILVAVGLCLVPRLTWRRGPWMAVSASAAVLSRQSSLFVVAPIGLAGALASPLARFVPAWLRLRREEDRRWGVFLSCALSVLVCCAVMAYLIYRWGGLTPPVYGSLHDAGANPASPVVLLALAGAFGLCFGTMLAPLWKRIGISRGLIGGMVVGAVAIVSIPETAPTWRATAERESADGGGGAAPSEPPLRGEWTDPTTGKTLRYYVAADPETWTERRKRAFGWSWRLAEMLPTPFERSLFHLALAPIGALFLLAATRGALASGHSAAAVLLLVTLAGWAAAQSMNSMAWHGYFEPKLLAFLPWLTAMAIGRARLPLWAWIGPAGLAAFQGMITCASLVREVWLLPG